MNTEFSKKKEKRSRSSSSDTNNSFVKNMTSRVSGLLPAAVAKWFSSPSSSTANGSAPAADATDSSTEDEALDSPITTQPPPKRRRFASPGNYNHYNVTETNCTVTDHLHEPEAITPYSSIQSSSRITFRRESNFVSTPLRPADDTSAEISKNDTSAFKTQHSVTAIGPSVATKRKSLFDSPTSAEASAKACAKSSCNTMRDPSQPCFKPSLLGSPFYPGRTMYGGASSSYINHPNIKQRKNTLVNESSTSDNTISHSTRRIMDLLENYSSPLSEARRIPNYTSVSRNSSLNNSLSSPSPPANKAISYKTQELHVPSIASILRLKQRSRLMDTTTAARQIIASHSSTIDYPYPSTSSYREQTEKESNSKLTTKVKSRLTRPNRGEGSDESELPAPLNLPSAVLQIDQNNLPKFSFGSSAATAPIPQPTVIESTKRTEAPLRKPDIVTSANPYQFSSPVRIDTDAPEAKTPPKFTFGSPERSVDKIIENNDEGSSVITDNKITKEPEKIMTEKDWKCPDCWVANKPEVEHCVCCNAKKPSKTTAKPKCTVCKLADSLPTSEKCVNCEKIKMNNISKPIPKADESKWKCEDCWVSNETNADVCVCCGARNPKKSSVIKQNPQVNDKDNEWKCDDCWIKNKSNVNKCAACGASKPDVKNTQPSIFSTPLSKPPDNTFKKIVNTQSDKWECPSCLVRNDGDKKKCVCCETEKEGTTQENDKKSFNFGTPNTTFKFGIDPKLAITSTPKITEVKFGISEKEQSETNNNVLSKTPTFTFGLPSKKPEDQTDSAKKTEEKVDNPPKVNFTFGIPKPAAETTGFIPIKPAPVKAVEEDKETPQVVPKVDLSVPSLPTQVAPKSLANMFASPLPSFGKPADKPATSTPILTASLTVEKKNPPITDNNPLISKPEATAAVSQPTTTFSFGSSTLKLAPNLFVPATTAASSAPFGSPIQSESSKVNMFEKNELTTTSSAMSVFPKSDTPSLFQKSETPATTAPLPLAASAPLFSFGPTASNTQSQLAQSEKPKFNFTFGSNSKTEAPSMFKPPETKFTFGATAENKFSLPTSNALGGISITGNTLGGGNGLSASNTISSNIISGGNGLSANQLSSGNDLSHNPISGGNGLPASSTLQAPSGGIFGAAVQKENVWSSANSNNMFGSNTSSAQKPAFSFGSSTPFNASSPAAPAFGNTQASNVFGMGQPATSQPSMFSTPTPAASMFGSPANTSATTSMGMFGSPNVGATPSFGLPNPSIPTFEAPSLTPAPAPAFNFGGQNQASGVFGFGQQPQQPQQQQQQSAGSVYSFGASPAGGAQMQFNMGSAPNAGISQRRMRKAVRRTTPR